MQIMIRARDEIPRANKAGLLNFVVLFNNTRPRAIPKIVENSARPFIKELMTSPLRTRMAREAILDVVTPEINPKRRNDKTIGIPVKSNFRNGSHGKRIFRPENFRV